MSASRVRIIVAPRERFGGAVASLDSLLAATRLPHELVYVDGGSPPAIAAALARRCAEVGARYVRREERLVPNAARNLGLRDLAAEYVAFVDNDVWFEPGWLEALVACADAMDAALVAPLTLIGDAEDPRVHLAGGELVWEERDGRRELHESHRRARADPASLPALAREPCDFAEFHAMLARRSALERTGPLDERLESTAEHVDLALRVAQAGLPIYFEPTSVVRYSPRGPLPLTDAVFFAARWSEARNRRSLAHFARTWQLDPDGPFATANRTFLTEHLARCPLPDPAAARPARPFDVCDHGYAQTPAQLYHQLVAAGADAWSLSRVTRACEAAVKLFAGLFRACRKPFLCHGVGTASILAAWGAPTPLVIAGLLHAAYSHGQFGDGRTGVTKARRAWLRRKAGANVEALVHRYRRSDWSRPPLPPERLDELEGMDAALCVLRAANELEERLDLALATTSKAPGLDPAWLAFHAALTARLGIPGLADELAAAVEANRRGELPAALCRRDGESFAVREATRKRVPSRSLRQRRSPAGWLPWR